MPNSLSTRPLPATRDELMAGRRHKPRTLVDELDKCIYDLWEDEVQGELVRRLANTTTNENSVEGSVRTDKQELARICRGHAHNHPNIYPLLAAEQLDPTRKKLTYAVKRWRPREEVYQDAAE